jgi:type IV secretory pathway TraG/TraD family ATPase VirD4
MDRVQDIFFGPVPTNIPPGTKIRRWDTSIGLGLVVGMMGCFLSIVVLWHPLPILGDINRDVTLPIHAMYWGEVVLAWVSGNNLFAENATQYIQAANHLPFGMIWGRLLIACSAGLASFFFTTRALLTPIDQIMHVEGARLRTGKDAKLQAKLEAQRAMNGAKPFMRIHPDMPLPKTKWTKHLLIYGGVGAGKTQVLIPIIRRIVKANRKAILYDVKGDYTSYFDTALLISPWDERSAIWGIGRDICTRDAAQEFASSIIPPSDKDPFWTNSAQFLLTGVLFSLQAEKGTSWGWQDLAERCNYDQAKLFDLMQRFYPKGANVIADSTSTQTGSVISTLAAYTRLIDDLAVAWGNTEGKKLFSLRDWLRPDYAGPRQIILQAGKGEKLTSAYIAAMINCIVPEIISPALTDDEMGRTLFFVLDEFTSLSKIKIQPLVDKGRSKGCCVVLGLQDLAQLRKVYGQEDAKSITSMVGTHIVCRVGPGETREMVSSQIIGKRRIATLNTNVSSNGSANPTTTTSYHEDERPIILPAQLSSELGVRQDKSPAGFSIRALYLSDGDVLMLDWPGTDTSKLQKRPSYIEAQWVKPIATTMCQEITATQPVAGAAAVAQPEAEVVSHSVEAGIASEASAKATNEVLAVVSEQPQPAGHATSHEGLEQLTEVAKEIVTDVLNGHGPDLMAGSGADIVAGHGAEMFSGIGAVLDILTSSPPAQKPKVKVFTGNVSRGR